MLKGAGEMLYISMKNVEGNEGIGRMSLKFQANLCEFCAKYWHRENNNTHIFHSRGDW